MEMTHVFNSPAQKSADVQESISSQVSVDQVATMRLRRHSYCTNWGENSNREAHFYIGEVSVL